MNKLIIMNKQLIALYFYVKYRLDLSFSLSFSLHFFIYRKSQFFKKISLIYSPLSFVLVRLTFPIGRLVISFINVTRKSPLVMKWSLNISFKTLGKIGFRIKFFIGVQHIKDGELRFVNRLQTQDLISAFVDNRLEWNFQMYLCWRQTSRESIQTFRKDTIIFLVKSFLWNKRRNKSLSCNF